MAAPNYVAQGVPTAVYAFVTLVCDAGGRRPARNRVQIWLQQVQSLPSAGCAHRSRPAKPFTGAAWRVQQPSRSS